MAELFGFEIRRKKDEAPAQDLGSFVPRQEEDGAVEVSQAVGGAYGQYLDLEATARSEAELITRYRRMALQSECEEAIDSILNEAIIHDADHHSDLVEVNLDDVEVTDAVKEKIRKEFDTVRNLYDFNRKGFEIFRHWYIDGRILYHIIIDEKKPQEGIKELRYIDPRKIRKIKQVEKKPINTRDPQSQRATITTVKKEFYLFNEKGFAPAKGQMPNNVGQQQGLKIANDAIVHCTSGLMSEDNKIVLSHLHKAIKPLNQLRVLEDAAVIYRITRAPERRIFYIDVGNLPKMKAEQYLRDMMTKHKNRLIYDAASGEIKDDRRFQTMIEDYWLPRREGGRGTQIDTLPAGQNLGEMDDVLYFAKKLYRSLNVPVSRLEPDQGFTLGRATEVTRDEVKFQKFINRLRLRFSGIFEKALEKQLILKGVIAPEDWPAIRQKIRFDFITDNHYAELKDLEILRERIGAAGDIDPYIHTYFSREWVRRYVLRQDQELIEEIDKQIEEEKEDQEDEFTDDMGQPQAMGMPGGPADQMQQPNPAAGGDAASGSRFPPAPGVNRESTEERLDKANLALIEQLTRTLEEDNDFED